MVGWLVRRSKQAKKAPPPAEGGPLEARPEDPAECAAGGHKIRNIVGSLTVVVPAHNRTAGDIIVVVVLTLGHRYDTIESVVTGGQAPITLSLEWKNTSGNNQTKLEHRVRNE